jgi:hypothetical protein
MAQRWSATDVDAPALPRKRGRLSLLALGAFIALWGAILCDGCSSSSSTSTTKSTTQASASAIQFPREASVPPIPIEQVIEQYTHDLLSIDGVEVVYAAENETHQPVITIGVAQKTDEILRTLPKAIEGYPVVIQETGPVAPR